MGRRVFIEVEDRNPFGEEFDESILKDSARDSTYIEGYSDVRTQRDLAVRDGKRPAPLRHRLQWVTAKTYDSQRAVGQRVQHWSVNKGYRMMGFDEAVKEGYAVDKNRAITKGEDGLAYLGERVLMVADAPTAAANLKRVLQDTEDLKEQPKRDMEAATERFNRETEGAHAEAFAYIGEDDPDE